MDEKQLASMRTSLRVFASQAVLQQDTVARKLGLTSSDMKCFRIISTDGPITPSELAKRTGLSTGGITKVLDHLEHYGAIVRHSGGSDRRSITVAAEPLEKTKIGDADIDFDRMVSVIMEGYAPSEVEIIKRFLDHTSSLLKEISEE